MKPKPFASLNHLTVPVAIAFPILVSEAEYPPEERLNQVRNYRLILHHCYSNLNVATIILEKLSTTA
jgi:hypothetical protein